MLRLCHFAVTTKRVVSIPLDNIDLIDLAFYPAREDTARDPDEPGFAQLEVRFKDQKRLVAKWEVTQNEFFETIQKPLWEDNWILRPAGHLSLRLGDRDGLGFTFIRREDFWPTEETKFLSGNLK